MLKRYSTSSLLPPSSSSMDAAVVAITSVSPVEVGDIRGVESSMEVMLVMVNGSGELSVPVVVVR